MINVSIKFLSPIKDLAPYMGIEELVDKKIVLLVNFLTGFSALVAIILIIIAGYTFITSSGDSDRVEKAGKMLTGAVVGLIIVFIARMVVAFILEKVIEGK